MSAHALLVMEPLTVTDAMLLGTDVPEDDFAAYSSVTTYGKGARVLDSASHKLWESVQAGNVGHTPGTDVAWWIDAGASNRWQAFDGKIGTRTAKANSLYYRFAPGVAVSCAAVFGLKDAQAVRWRLIDPVEGTVFDETQDVGPVPRVADPWEWVYGVWWPGRSKALRFDLTAYPGAELRLDITGGAGLAVGTVLFGQVVAFGDGVRYGLRLGIKDYGVKVTDQWGNLDMQEGDFSEENGFDLEFANDELDALNEYLASVRSRKCLFVASDQWNSTMLYGKYNRYEIVISFATTSVCAFDIEGLTNAS